MTGVAGSADLIADVETIRGHFPALARRHKGHPVAYLDGPQFAKFLKEDTARLLKVVRAIGAP